MMGDIITKYYNNSLDNIGERDSFVWYGMYCREKSPNLQLKIPV
jgi:hypothetical protein